MENHYVIGGDGADFHPDLQRVARWLPRFSFSWKLVRFLRLLMRLRGTPAAPVLDDIAIDDVQIPAADGTSIRARVYRPRGSAREVP